MKQNEVELLNIPDSVKRDTAGFRTKLAAFLEGKSSDAAFKAYRVPMGIYEHRKKGEYMARIRLTAGMVTPSQLKSVAALSRKYGDGVVHITTRQDLQIHRIAIENLADVLEQLLENGISTRGGGGNTVRNISSCPMAGICPNQKFDVSPHSIATTEYMLKSNDSFNLPRKYKITFSGCGNDCAFASVADLGFFAHIKDGVKGFAVYAAGGMGANPSIAVKLEDFVPESDIFDISQAIKEIFDQNGDRVNRHKARLRYVLSRLGEEKFVDIYRQKRLEIKQRSQKDYPAIRDIHQPKYNGNLPDGKSDLPANVLKQNTDGLFSIKLNLKLGNIPYEDLVSVAEIAEKYSLGLLRTTQSQDILITSVPAENIEAAINTLGRLSVDITGKQKANIVTCTGADTCQLGLCLAKGLADAISQRISSLDVPQETIRISGCPNSCGQHHVAKIGFQGRVKRLDGKMMPCYDLLVGGEVGEGKTVFAKQKATFAAKDIPDFLYDVFKQKACNPEKIDGIVEKYSDLSRDFSNDYFYDFGACEAFSLKGRGAGECGAGVLDVIKADIDEAKKLIEGGSATSDGNIYKAVIFASKSLLILYGHEPQKDRETLKLFKENIINTGYVAKDSEQLLEAVIDYKLGDIDTLKDKFEQTKHFVERVEQLFLSLDSSLKFQIAPLAEVKIAENVEEAQNRTVDLRGVACPLNFVKAKLELEKVQIGQSISILLDEGEPIRNVPASFISHGQEVLRTDKKDEYYIVEVKRNK